MKSIINPIGKATEYLNITLGIQDCYRKPIRNERISELINIFTRDYSNSLTQKEISSAKKELELGMNLYNLVNDKVYSN